MNPHETLGLNNKVLEESTSSPDNTYTYERFAKQPEYKQVNRELLELIIPHLPDNFFHVDVATGTGLVPQLIIEGIGENRKGKIIGIDPNSTSLDIAIRNTPNSSNISVEFIEGFGQHLETILAEKIPSDGVDSVSIHDALHEIRSEEDKRTVLQKMANILKPGGILSFNSAFTTEAIKLSYRPWASWKFRAIEILGGQKRDKQVKTMPIYTPNKYKEMIQSAGLMVIHEKLKQVTLSKEALEAISMYPAFIKGVFEDIKGHEDISEEVKSNALIQALDKENIIELPRIWYEIVAQKPVS